MEQQVVSCWCHTESAESRYSESNLDDKNNVNRQLISSHGFILSKCSYASSYSEIQKPVGYRSTYLALIVLDYIVMNILTDYVLMLYAPIQQIKPLSCILAVLLGLILSLEANDILRNCIGNPRGSMKQNVRRSSEMGTSKSHIE